MFLANWFVYTRCAYKQIFFSTSEKDVIVNFFSVKHADCIVDETIKMSHKLQVLPYGLRPLDSGEPHCVWAKQQRSGR